MKFVFMGKKLVWRGGLCLFDAYYARWSFSPVLFGGMFS